MLGRGGEQNRRQWPSSLARASHLLRVGFVARPMPSAYAPEQTTHWSLEESRVIIVSHSMKKIQFRRQRVWGKLQTDADFFHLGRAEGWLAGLEGGFTADKGVKQPLFIFVFLSLSFLFLSLFVSNLSLFFSNL